MKDNASGARTEISPDADETVRRGAAENGVFDACDSAGAGESVHIAAASWRSSGRKLKQALFFTFTAATLSPRSENELHRPWQSAAEPMVRAEILS